MLRVLIRPGRLPASLLIAPQDIRVADPTVANDIYAGHYALAGRVFNGHGRSPFEAEPPSAAWEEALHGFSWLRHLRAADTALARANARALVEDWIGSVRADRLSIAGRPAVVARRIVSWLSHSAFLLEGAEPAFYRRLLRSLMMQAAALRRALALGLAGEDRLWAALALAEVSLCIDRHPPARSAAPLLAELDRQVLPDGGHISRDPQVVVELLLDLLPLRQAYAARGAEVPAPVLNAIDRMMPALRLFRHADGSLALFNGMGVTEPEALATVLAHDDARAMPLANAPYSGYQRLVAGDGIVICDTGVPPPPAFSSEAHAGTLAFEFSTAGQKLIVNCGRPRFADPAMRAAARATAAHSALIVADTSSSRFEPRGRASHGIILDGPTTVQVRRPDGPAAAALDGVHDGYGALGFLHRRQLALAEEGAVLTGQDDLLPSGTGLAAAGTPFALRFHLHPSTRPAYAADGRGVVITLQRGAIWRFEADGLAAAIEESVYFGSAEGPRRCEQIVVQGRTGRVNCVRWSFARIAA